ncbi:hypothetical protein QVD17_27460 [Tagetes erecta]|uniref:Uncharacterized protein n=1 Tax=Tagetes erecta TaxID=13708 RepID=A0AAD8KD78_TARER|nr:hypothetical protein QVD17_27460 [Tagetes erecta]
MMMMMKQDSNPSTNHPTLATVCGQCGIDEPKFLHNIRHRSNFRRLCTTCVLRLHPQCFCPACFGVYDRIAPIDAVVCYKCYSCSHSNCVPSPPAGTITSSRSPSPCSSCINPNLLVFNLNRLENGSRMIDGNAARLLLAAGKIASMSMNKAEVAAANEAERRAKEAAYTKKRAKEALDHVVSLMRKEKRNVVVVESNKKVCSVGNSVGCYNKGDASSEVLEALNAVELKDNGMKVDVVDGKGAGVNSVDENGNELKVVKLQDSSCVMAGEIGKRSFFLKVIS